MEIFDIKGGQEAQHLPIFLVEMSKSSQSRWIIQMIETSRKYNPPKGNGVRILVDRLWPRGLNKENAKVDLWIKEIGPSNELRRWFGHDPKRWPGFKARYFQELEGKSWWIKL